MVLYRPNVAALILNKKDQLLICERVNNPGAWQFPQGGVDDGEPLLDALYREIKEEIGLEKNDYQIIREQSGYRYLYPTSVQEKKVRKHGFHGQVQSYYLCRLEKKSSPINVKQKPPEFQDFQWIDPKDFKLSWLPKFKREVYKKVMLDFFDIEIS